MQVGPLQFVTLLFYLNLAYTDENRHCESKIFCYGQLLHFVQMSELFQDSKHFVDMPLKYDEKTVLENFKDLLNISNNRPSREQLQLFLQNNFDEPGNEFDEWDPSDWQEDIPLFEKFSDPNVLQWAKDLNFLWKELGRKVSEVVKTNPDMYSQLYISHPVIVPGGRFREFYYWDSYWIIKGLLISNMTVTVKGMLLNYIEMVKRYGMVPNGGRIYYTRRSQPPFLIPMVKLYIDKTNDIEFLKDNIYYLEEEYNFWLRNRSLNLYHSDVRKNFSLIRYNVASSDPRPESYKEDYVLASMAPFIVNKSALLSEMAASAESGWDFSSRWFLNNGTNKGALWDTSTSSIIPVDLNSFMCYNAKIMAELYSLINVTDKEHYFKKQYKLRAEIIDIFHWSKEYKIWFDYDYEAKKHRNYFYISNFTPLWTGCYGSVINRTEIVNSVLQHIIEDDDTRKALEYIGCVPTSSINTGEQWDLPNCWPPMQHMLIMGFASLDNEKFKDLAFKLAKKWLNNNYKTYNETGYMYEKYDATIMGPGGGGEYDVQLGYGWTNAIALDLLEQFGEELLSNANFVFLSLWTNVVIALNFF